MEINDRINQIIDREHLSIAAFARKIGIGDQTIRSVCVQKRNKPGYDVLAAIACTFEWLNTDWLLTGEGNMEKTVDEMKNTANDTSSDIDKILNYMREKDQQIKELIEEKTEWRVKYELMSTPGDKADPMK